MQLISLSVDKYQYLFISAKQDIILLFIHSTFTAVLSGVVVIQYQKTSL